MERQGGEVTNKVILILVIAVVAAAALTAVFFDRALIFAVSKYNGIETSYSKLHRESGAIVLDDLFLTEGRRMVGLYCKRAVLKPTIKDLFKNSLEVYFNLEDASFKKLGDPGNPSSDPLSAIVLVPFEGAWSYSNIEGDFLLKGRAVTINRFDAVGKDLKFSINGDVHADDTISLSIKIYFSKDVLTRLPDELTKVVLQDEEDSWKTLAVKLDGDYKAPAIQLTGKLFKLKIPNK